MGIRVGTSWRTGPGHRAWVSMPLWLLVLAVPFIVTAWLLIAAVWLIAQGARLVALLAASVMQAIREEREARSRRTAK